MSIRSRLFFLSTVLAVDIFFFMGIGQYYPEGFTRILDFIPFNNEVEAAVIILGGLVVAIVCALLLVRLVISQLGKVLG